MPGDERNLLASFKRPATSAGDTPPTNGTGCTTLGDFGVDVPDRTSRGGVSKNECGLYRPLLTLGTGLAVSCSRTLSSLSSGDELRLLDPIAVPPGQGAGGTSAATVVVAVFAPGVRAKFTHSMLVFCAPKYSVPPSRSSHASE